jgi:branched-chain amino acid transport system permease protein
MSRARLRGAVAGWLMLSVILAVLVSGAQAAGTAQMQRVVTDFLLTAVLVVGLQVFVGNSGIVSFGHMALVGVGAYTAALVTIPPAIKEQTLTALPGWLEALQLGFVPSVLLGMVAAVIVAALIGGAIARMSELGFAMATLALLVLVHAILANWDSVTRGGYGIFGIPNNATPWGSLAGLVVVLLVARLYRAAQPGLRVQAAREDPVSARAVGVNVAVSRFGSWMLSASIMGAGGAMLAQQLLAFDPDQFYFTLTFSTLAMLVVGGRESVTGAVAGAAMITVVSEALRRAERGFSFAGIELPELPGLVQLVIAALIILVLVFRPAGLLGRRELDDVPGAAAWLSRPRRPQAEPGGLGTEVDGSAVGRRHPLALELSDIVMAFEGLRALSGVSLELRRGEILGLIGPNGSGKTTLVNIVAGMFKPTAGTVRLWGDDVTGWPPHRMARVGLARTFQSIRLFGGLTVEENLLAAADGNGDDDEVARLLSLFDLSEHANDPAGTLAYGVQRRVEAARAAIRRPSVLLLDEPAAGMNEMESEQLLEIIRRIRDELAASVVVIDHDLRMILRLSDRVHVLNEGATIAEGAPEDVARDPRVVEAYVGMRPASG